MDILFFKKHLGETKLDPDISFVSTASASMREEVIKLFKELREIMDKFSTVLIALVAANNTTDTGANSLFKNQDKKLVMFLVLIIAYYLMLVVRTVLVQLTPQNTRFLPIITFIIAALLGSSASVLALVII